jgi:ABC-type antimicrobial peptide transport system permease subunit
MRIVLWGAALGIVLALYVARLIAAFLYDVSPRDPAAMAVATAALLSVALAASWLPARRAARVDPVTALRTE